MFLMFFLYRLELSLWNKNINIRNGYASAHTTKYPLDCKTVLTWILKYPTISDESEPSWLKPELELNDFKLGSWPFPLQLEIENRPKTSQNFDFDLIFLFI